MRGPENIVYCEHTEDVDNGGNSRVHRTVTCGKHTLVLCRACYGELLTQIVEDLKTVTVEVRQSKW